MAEATFMDPTDVLDLWGQLALERSGLLRQMDRSRRAYNDEIDLDLPEQYKFEEPAIPNLMEEAVDQFSLRIVSTMPDVQFPPLRPGIETSEEKARKRRMTMLAMWDMNDFETMLQRRAMQLLTYAVGPIMLRPKRWEDGTIAPRWHMRDPFGVYPGETENPDDVAPPYCMYAFQRSWSWIERNYAEAAARIERPKGLRKTDRFTLLEYNDDREISLFLVGNRNRQPSPDIAQTRGYGEPGTIWTPGTLRGGTEGTSRIEPLHREVNRTEMCWAVVPQRTTLDKPKGKFEGMIGKYIARARLFALEYLAVTAGVFPDTWVFNDDINVEPKIVTMADGRRGRIGKIVGGKLMPVVTNPGYMTPQLLDRIEQNERIEGGIPPDLTGQSGTNVRTGRRGDAILGATIDFTIQAAQRMLSASMKAETRIAGAIDLAYSRTAKKSYYFAWTKAEGRVDYKPEDIWESFRNTVNFPFAGADMAELIIGLGQRLGLDTVSQRTVMEKDPMIRDVDGELDRINAEKINSAFWAWVQQQVAQGAFAPQDIAELKRLIVSNKMSPEDALDAVQLKAQQRQANAGPPGTPEGPVPPGSAEAMPGVAGPEAGAEAGTIGATPGMENFAGMLQSLYPGQQAMAQARRAS